MVESSKISAKRYQFTAMHIWPQNFLSVRSAGLVASSRSRLPRLWLMSMMDPAVGGAWAGFQKFALHMRNAFSSCMHREEQLHRKQAAALS